MVSCSIPSFAAEPKRCEISAVQTLVTRVCYRARFSYRLLVRASRQCLWRATRQHCTTATVWSSCFNCDPAISLNQITAIIVNVLMCGLPIILLKFCLIQWCLACLIHYVPAIVTARSKAWTVFARSNTGIVCSNPTQTWMSVCVYSMFVLSCVQAAAWRRSDPLSTGCVWIKKLKKRPRSTRAVEPQIEIIIEVLVSNLTRNQFILRCSIISSSLPGDRWRVI
jgi:hypothetical protein